MTKSDADLVSQGVLVKIFWKKVSKMAREICLVKSWFIKVSDIFLLHHRFFPWSFSFFFFSVWILSNTSKQFRQIGKFSRTFPEAGKFHRSRRLWTHLLKANLPAILFHCASWYMSRITSFEISACE